MFDLTEFWIQHQALKTSQISNIGLYFTMSGCNIKRWKILTGNLCNKTSHKTKIYLYYLPKKYHYIIIFIWHHPDRVGQVKQRNQRLVLFCFTFHVSHLLSKCFGPDSISVVQLISEAPHPPAPFILSWKPLNVLRSIEVTQKIPSLLGWILFPIKHPSNNTECTAYPFTAWSLCQLLNEQCYISQNPLFVLLKVRHEDGYQVNVSSTKTC